jgi:NCAIR mutase (PurE)-related protein
MNPDTLSTGDATIDLARADRCGFPEVVYGPGKRPESIAEIFEAQQAHGQPCLATRVDRFQVEAVQARFPNVIVNEMARTIRLLSPKGTPVPSGKVAVLTAGTTDLPVAEEAVETLRWMNTHVELIVDVGVAGPQRLIEAKPRFVNADAVVVVAGMEGALPSVVGGHVACPVIAVPTSVGYGAAFGGIAALLGMLNSCASNVTVVNIDAGFKAGYVAGLIATRAAATS